MSRNNDDKINWRFAVFGLMAGLAMLVITPAKAEYADVIINNYADAAGQDHQRSVLRCLS